MQNGFEATAISLSVLINGIRKSEHSSQVRLRVVTNYRQRRTVGVQASAAFPTNKRVSVRILAFDNALIADLVQAGKKDILHI